MARSYGRIGHPGLTWVNAAARHGADLQRRTGTLPLPIADRLGWEAIGQREEPSVDTITWNDFNRVELRVGRIVEARPFPEARKPAYVLQVDFGPEIGLRKSSAQITDLYRCEELVGKLVVAVVNFPPKQIGPLQSQCLVTGFHDEANRVALCVPDRPVPPGTKLL
jgi:tRNA-binding protein